MRGRLDPSDVIQEAFLEATERRPEYAREPDPMPPFLWLRFLTLQRLQIAPPPRHLGTCGARCGPRDLHIAHASPAASSVADRRAAPWAAMRARARWPSAPRGGCGFWKSLDAMELDRSRDTGPEAPGTALQQRVRPGARPGGIGRDEAIHPQAPCIASSRSSRLFGARSRRMWFMIGTPARPCRRRTPRSGRSWIRSSIASDGASGPRSRSWSAGIPAWPRSFAS